MSENAEYDQLICDRNNTEAKIEAANNKKIILQEKVDRLKDAKKVLDRCYDDFGDVKNDVTKILQDKYSWYGAKRNEHAELGAYLIYCNGKYHNNVDTVRDEINMEIANLENEIYRQTGIIGELRAIFNSICHRIENFFNN